MEGSFLYTIGTWMTDPLPILVQNIRPAPSKLMELGVAKGTGAKLMIKAAKKAGATKVDYYGFDFFEIRERERVKKILEKTGATVHLFEGDIHKTLTQALKILPKMDFIYSDFATSYDDARHAWECIQKIMHKRTVVVFTGPRIREGVNLTPHITKLMNEIVAEETCTVQVISTRSMHFLPIPSIRPGSKRCIIKPKGV